MPCSKHEKLPQPAIAMPAATSTASAHEQLATLAGAIPAFNRELESGSMELSDLESDNSQSTAEKTPWTTAKRQMVVGQLLEEHFDRVYRYAYYLSGCSSVAEDIAQEVFLRAFRSIHQLRSQEASVSWLLTIARNEFGRYCQSRKASLDVDKHEPVDETDRIRQIDCLDWVQNALQQLPIEFRTVVLMFYFEEKSYLQIASELELPMGTVMSRLSRARCHLKQALEAQSGALSSESKTRALVKDHQ